MGRYKFNKKLTLWTRPSGQKLAEPVADPATGELLLEEGHVLTGDDCRRLLDAVGVSVGDRLAGDGDSVRRSSPTACAT